MNWDWILVRIGQDFHFLASKWHLIASKCPKFAVPWKWRFPARPFYSQMQWAKMRLDWIQLRICPNFPFLASKWPLTASKYPKSAIPWKLRFTAEPFSQNNLLQFFWNFHGTLLKVKLLIFRQSKFDFVLGLCPEKNSEWTYTFVDFTKDYLP